MKTYKQYLEYRLHQLQMSDIIDNSIEEDLVNGNIYIEILLDRTSTPKFGYDIWKYDADMSEWIRITDLRNWGLTTNSLLNKKNAIIEALTYLINKQ